LKGSTINDVNKENFDLDFMSLHELVSKENLNKRKCRKGFIKIVKNMKFTWGITLCPFIVDFFVTIIKRKEGRMNEN